MTCAPEIVLYIDVTRMAWNEGEESETGGQGEIKFEKILQKEDRKEGKKWLLT